jgi:hypothetical protein
MRVRPSKVNCSPNREAIRASGPGPRTRTRLEVRDAGTETDWVVRPTGWLAVGTIAAGTVAIGTEAGAMAIGTDAGAMVIGTDAGAVLAGIDNGGTAAGMKRLLGAVGAGATLWGT